MQIRGAREVRGAVRHDSCRGTRSTLRSAAIQHTCARTVFHTAGRSTRAQWRQRCGPRARANSQKEQRARWNFTVEACAVLRPSTPSSVDGAGRRRGVGYRRGVATSHRPRTPRRTTPRQSAPSARAVVARDLVHTGDE